MTRAPLVAGLVIVALLSGVTAGPARAQTSPASTSTSLPPTTSTTAPVATSPTSTTVAPTTPSSTSLVAPPTTVVPTTLAPATPSAPPAPTPVDPKAPDNSDEPPPTAAVPARTTPHVPTPVDQAVTKVLDQQVKAAQLASAAALAGSQAADLALTNLEAEQRTQRQAVEALDADEGAAAQKLASQRQSMRIRAVAIYVAGPSVPVIPAGNDIQEYGRRRVLLQSLYSADRRTLGRYVAAKKAAGNNIETIVGRLDALNAKVIAARADATAKAASVQSGLRGVGAAQAIGPTAINGFAFPVAQPHNFVDTFGAPRSGGRTHEGNDIFAVYGTPLLAAERGVLARVGTNTLGGTKLWVIGESGTSYYYAHLSAYAIGVADGILVEPGTVVGYVGNSGDAITTPPHLHFEIHPGGGPAINPYAILKAADDATKLLAIQQPAPVIAPPTLPLPGATPAAVVP